MNINKFKLVATFIIAIISIWIFIKNSFHESYPFLIVSAMILTYMYSKKRSIPRYVIQLSAIFVVCYAPIIMAVRGYSRHHAVLLGFLLMAFLSVVLTYIYRKHLPFKVIPLTMILTITAFEMPLRIMHFSSTLGTLPSFVFAIGGIAIGYALFRKRNFKNWILASIVSGFAIWVYCEGSDMWSHKLNFGTYTGQVNKKITQDYTFQDEKGSTIQLSQMKGKIVLLDFWSTRCGGCWKKFPEVQKLYDAFRANEKVIVSGVFVEYHEQEWDNNIKELRNKYSFPTFRVSKDNPLIADLPITIFPTVVVLNQKGELIYLGNIDGASKLLNKLGDLSLL